MTLWLVGLRPRAATRRSWTSEKRRALAQTDRMLEAFGPKAQFAFDPNGETAVRFSARSWTPEKRRRVDQPRQA
ncbi:hypothetical protein J9303_02700 [Bacillaceae bacterium Marseille-Q3522]|nr:hypothetical protein [Bacillaceae bacterium Marseille-Q3522]